MTPPERPTPPISRRGGAAKRRPRQRGPGNRVVCSQLSTLTIAGSGCLPMLRTRPNRSCLSPVPAVGAARCSPMPTGQIADSCVLWTGFDISIVARNYAQLAGVLAGFAFVVINLVLDRGYRRRGDGRSRAAHEVEHETLTGVALMNAFLGLFLSAIQYSLLAGENGCSLTGGRAASAELLGGISFVA